MTSDKQPTRFWSKRKFWSHLLTLFAVFVYFYSPIVDHALGHHIHSRPHNHIPIQLVHEHNHFAHALMHGHHHFPHDHGLHAESDATDSHICSLEGEGLILLGIFLAFIALTRQPIRNAFVYKVKTTWIKISLTGQPPPNPPPRYLSLAI